ncbi:peroxiredoxin family protein [Marinilabilia sp.]
MKRIIHHFSTLTIFVLIFTLGCQKPENDSEYLKEVLINIENIKSASYHNISKPFQPGDTIPKFVNICYVKEFDHPSDTIIGSSFIELEKDDTTMIRNGYDGLVQASGYHEHKGLLLDSFKVKRAPFRLVRPPFFNYTESIIKYAFETSDSIKTTYQDMGDSLVFKLTINEDQQVEFFGQPKYIDNPYTFGDNSSNYTIWIDKETDLPYKVKRSMAHSVSSTEVHDVKINHLDIEEFRLADYFPKNYEIREYGLDTYKKNPNAHDLLSQAAPDWTLSDFNNRKLALKDLGSKMILLQFTGIGCGPCQASIPTMKRMSNDYKHQDLKLISLETWTNNIRSLKHYSEKNEMNYIFLNCPDEIKKAYKVTGVPVFFVLDENRKVRKVIKGFSEEKTEKDLRAAVNELL